MEKEDNIIAKWAQEDVETSHNLLNNNNYVENSDYIHQSPSQANSYLRISRDFIETGITCTLIKFKIVSHMSYLKPYQSSPSPHIPFP